MKKASVIIMSDSGRTLAFELEKDEGGYYHYSIKDITGLGHKSVALSLGELGQQVVQFANDYLQNGEGFEYPYHKPPNLGGFGGK